MEEVVKILYPNKISQIPISRHTTELRITKSMKIKSKLKNDFKTYVTFSLALDKSTDIHDNSQLAVIMKKKCSIY